MKKITVLAAALVFGLSFTSCSSDDNADSVAEPVLAGKWEYSKQGVAAQGIESLQNYPNTAGCSKDYILLNANNSFDEALYDKDGAECIEDKESGSYSVANNVITLDYADSTFDDQYVVLSITQSELKVKMVTEETNGVDIIYVFTRG